MGNTTPLTQTIEATAPARAATADGDVLEFVSTHAGTNGLADPGGRVHVEFTRS